MRIKKNFSKYLILLLFLLPSFILFWQFFPRDLYPFPGNYMLAWYEPWKTDNFNNGSITVSHKPIAEDVFRQIIPFRILGIDLLKDFKPPLWNPYGGSGMPLFATNNTGILDPFNLLFLFFPPLLAWSLYISIQPILILFFTYFFAKKINLGTTASIAAAFIFALSGCVITRYVYGIYGVSFALLPLGLLSIESFVHNKSGKWLLLLPLITVFLFVSTQPQITFYIILFFLIYFLYRARDKKVENKLKIYISFIFFIFLGICLSAIQLISTAKLYTYANITEESSSFIFNNFLLRPWEFITVLIPNYFGNPSTYNFWGRVDYIQTAIYFGLIPAFFVLIALFKRKKILSSHILFFSASFLISIFLTTDNPLTNFLYSLPIPIVSTGIPERIFIISSLAFALLAGYGMDYWIKSKDKKRSYLKPIALCIAVALGILIITIFIKKLGVSCPEEIKNCNLVALRNTLLEVFAFVVGLSFFTLSFFVKENLKKYLVFLVIFILICVGIYNAWKFMPYSPANSFYPSNELILKLQALKDGRTFGMGSSSFSTDLHTYLKIYSAQYYHPLYVRRYGELVSFGNSQSITKTLKRSDVEIINGINLSMDDRQRRRKLLNLLGVSYVRYRKSELPKTIPYKKIVWQDKDWIIYKNEMAVPRVYFVSSFKVFNSDDKLLNYLFSSGFKPKEMAALETNPFINLEKSKSYVISQNFLENSMEAKVYTQKTGLLVVDDNYYSGWKAFVDGKETPIFRTNYSFRSVVIPPGTHILNMVYDPLAFKVGLFITLAASIFYLLIVFGVLFKQGKSVLKLRKIQ
jgi:hypothetical protein